MNRSRLNGEEAEVNSSKANLKHTNEKQVSCGVHPKVSAQGDVWWIRQEIGPIMRAISPTERERRRRGASHGRSCAHDVVDSAVVFGIGGDGVHQGEDCDSDRSMVYGSDEELCWVEFLSQGLLRVDGGTRRKCATTSEIRRKKIVDSIN